MLISGARSPRDKKEKVTMSSYAESVLADGEKIVHRAAISHWKYAFHYLVGALFVAGGLYGVVTRDDILSKIAMAPLAIGLILIVIALIRRLTTELVLTDRRIITKSGLISRNTVEMNLAKIESIHVNQGLLGRILNYGDVTVVGTGSSLEPLRGIADPLQLRIKLGEVTQRMPKDAL
jgi:uncharacterized membrane protein YdbT with pleckstrin-like domain